MVGTSHGTAKAGPEAVLTWFLSKIKGQNYKPMKAWPACSICPTFAIDAHHLENKN